MLNYIVNYEASEQLTWYTAHYQIKKESLMARLISFLRAPDPTPSLVQNSRLITFYKVISFSSDSRWIDTELVFVRTRMKDFYMVTL